MTIDSIDSIACVDAAAAYRGGPDDRVADLLDRRAAVQRLGACVARRFGQTHDRQFYENKQRVFGKQFETVKQTKQ
jgi:hypothetical protein